MWPRTDLAELLEIEHPIIQAPMAGEATPEMAIAVSNAGGLGGLGCSFMTIDELESNVSQLRQGTDHSFNLNFFAHPQPVNIEEVNDKTRALRAPFCKELKLSPILEQEPLACETFNEERLAALLELRPKVVSFHFGLPGQDMIEEIQRTGCKILCTATTVAEADFLASAGCDAIIAQGWEAGGHRGTFEPSFEDFGVGTFSLVPQIVDAVNVPVIAAGGIADGRGIAAAFALGAAGVQMGTAFLSCPEANIDDTYKQALRSASDDDTRLTRAFSGRPARAKNTRYIEEMAKERVRLPDFPLMYGFSDPLNRQGSAKGCADFEFLIYGQSAALNREMSAAKLVETLISEAMHIFGNKV